MSNHYNIELTQWLDSFVLAASVAYRAPYLTYVSVLSVYYMVSEVGFNSNDLKDFAFFIPDAKITYYVQRFVYRVRSNHCCY